MKNRILNALSILAVCACVGGCGGNSVVQGGFGDINLSLTTLSFDATFGLPSNPSTLDVNLTNSGTGALSFTAASDSSWLTVSPASGTAPQTLGVTATLGSLGVGTHTGHVTVTSSGAQNSPATITVTFVVAPSPANEPFWAQWGANPQHGGMVSVTGQNAAEQLADIVYDPFVSQEQSANNGELTVHYQAPITDGNDVYFMTKTGTYSSSDWSKQQWNEARYTWINGTLTSVWAFASDWKPEPDGAALQGWEPVFHAADANGFIYVPGAGGTVWKVTQLYGTAASHINPFSGMGVTAADTFVAGPLTADSAGNIYYNVIELAGGNGDPWQSDVQGAWLVRIAPDDSTKVLTFASLVPGAPAGSATTCPGQFSSGLPWPPSNVVGTNQAAPTVACGSQRPGINIAPAVAPDGTVYTASRAQFDGMQAYLIAVKPDFSGPKWAASLQDLLHDGCGVLVPIGPNNNTPNACRVGATVGVDPTTNAPGSGVILDEGSSSPTVLPDGSVIFGALTNYNALRGHMLKFDSAGNFQGAYDFGWDSTPAVYTHGGTYSIVVKDNHYDVGLYCQSGGTVCAPLPPGPYYITQLDPYLNVEWKFQSTNTQSCTRGSGGVTCKNTNPNGFEWCINMPAVDANGNVYATSEDGNVYVLPQGHSGVFTTPTANLFLNLAEGAAYTPLSIGPDGKLYTQNDGHLFVVGN